MDEYHTNIQKGATVMIRLNTGWVIGIVLYDYGDFYDVETQKYFTHYNKTFLYPTGVRRWIPKNEYYIKTLDEIIPTIEDGGGEKCR